MAIDLRDPAELLLAKALVNAWNHDITDAKDEDTVMDQAHELIQRILATRVEAVARTIHESVRDYGVDELKPANLAAIARRALGTE